MHPHSFLDGILCSRRLRSTDQRGLSPHSFGHRWSRHGGDAACQAARLAPLRDGRSVEKRRFLENPSLYCDAVPKTELSSRILDSRSLDFAEQILSRTKGKGVDAVLNSLPGEAIPKGLSCLAIGGRFLEIGKRDIYGDAPLGLYPMRNNLSFFAIDLDQLFKTQPKRMGRLLRETVDRFDRGELKPLPTTSFRCEETNQAFRLMQQGKHLGKVAVTMSSPGREVLPGEYEPLNLPAHATYWVAGGLGGFGFEIAKWLVARGARHLVLSGRNAVPSEEAADAIAAMQKQGARIHCISADLTKSIDVQKVSCTSMTIYRRSKVFFTPLWCLKTSCWSTWISIRFNAF